MGTFKTLVPKWLVCLILVVFVINPTVCASASSDDDEPQEILKEGSFKMFYLNKYSLTSSNY
jgi:hypothetical protein